MSLLPSRYHVVLGCLVKGSPALVKLSTHWSLPAAEEAALATGFGARAIPDQEYQRLQGRYRTWIGQQDEETQAQEETMAEIALRVVPVLEARRDIRLARRRLWRQAREMRRELRNLGLWSEYQHAWRNAFREAWAKAAAEELA